MRKLPKAAVYACRTALIVILYFVTAHAGLLLSSVDGRVTLVWPPAGIALAAVLLYDFSAWPALALAAFLTNISIDQPGRLAFALVTTVGNPLGAVVGTLLLRKAGFCRGLMRMRDVIALLILGAGCAPLVPALMGSVGLAFLSPNVSWQRLPNVLAYWWLGDAMGVMSVTPLLLTLLAPERIRRPVNYTELVIWAGALACMAFVTFRSPVLSLDPFTVALLPCPLLLWAAMRFGPRLTIAAGTTICYLAVWWVASGLGPFFRPSRTEALERLWEYMSVVMIWSMLAAVVVERRRAAEHGLRAAQDELENRVRERTRELERLASENERIFTLPLDLICVAGTDGYFRRVNPAFERVLGYSAADLLSHPLFDFVHVDDHAPTLRELQKLGEGYPTVFFENRYRCRDGSYKWLEWIATPLPNEQLIYAIARDITDRKRAERAEMTLLATELRLRIAKSIQVSLLPVSPPQLPGYDIACLSDASEGVGGDYFDFIPLADNSMGVVIADATGHGLGPALLMAVTRTCLWALAEPCSGSIEQMLKRTNDVLYRGTPDNCFVGMVMIQLYPSARKFRAANCGHPAALLIDSDGSVKEQISSNAMPLGCFADCRLSESTQNSLAPGDLLLLATDGISEAESPAGEPFGEERILDVMCSSRRRPAVEIAETLKDAVQNFRHAEAADDVTAVVLKVLDS